MEITKILSEFKRILQYLLELAVGWELSTEIWGSTLPMKN
jgi:hypothetical protein